MSLFIDAVEKKLRFLFRVVEQSPCSIVITDLEGRIEYVNPKFTRLTGYTAEEVIGKNPSILKSGESSPERYKELWETISSGREWTGEFHNRKKNGELYWEMASISPILDTMGRTTHFLAIKEDITERKRAEEELSLFRQLMDHSNDGIQVIDPETGRFLDVNTAFCKCLGYSREELLERHVWDIEFDAIRQAYWRGYVERLKQAGCRLTEGRHRRRDGSVLPVDISLRYVELGRAYIVATTRDITERKAMDEALLSAQRIECIGTLAGGIAHDLNNVLGPILLAASVLAPQVSPEALEFVRTIEASAARGANIAHQVLAFAKGVKGERSPLQVRHIIKEMQNVASNTFPKSIAVRTSVPNDLWTVVGDAAQIEQMLLNICINAREAMPSGGTLSMGADNILLTAAEAAALGCRPGACVLLTFSDNGAGIAPDNLPRIFDPFFSTKQKSNDSGLGLASGLGLSTVMGIARSHGGAVGAASELGKGTTLSIYIPALPDEMPDSVIPMDTTASPTGSGELILVVDDEAAVRTATEAILKQKGYRVIVAADAVDAFSICSRQIDEIKMVLTDLAMPNLDGTDLIRVLKRMNGDLCIVVSSGYPEAARIEELTRLGVKTFLPKPFSAEELLVATREAIYGGTGAFSLAQA